MATTAIQRVQRYKINLKQTKETKNMNKKMWNLYKDSEDGKKVIDAFNPGVEDVYAGIEGMFEYAKKIGCTVGPSPE